MSDDRLPTMTKLKEVLDSPPVRNPEKLARQQAYYQRLLDMGIAKKEKYKRASFFPPKSRKLRKF